MSQGNVTVPAPLFGVGPPGPSLVPNTTGRLYFDTSTSPWTEYVFYRDAAWHQAGSSGGGSAGFTLTAAENIPANSAVSVNNLGQAVKSWGPAPNVAGVVNPFGATQFFDGTILDFAALQLDANDFVFFGKGQGAIPATLSGSAITLGTLNNNVAFLTTPWAYSNGPQIAPVSVGLSGSLFVTAYPSDGSANLDVVASSISGGVITVGAPVNVEASAIVDFKISFAKLSATSFLLGWESGTGINLVVGTVSGTTITLGAIVNIATALTGQGPPAVQVQALSATHAVITYIDSGTTRAAAVVGTISGTTLTLGTAAICPHLDQQVCIVALSATSFVMGGRSFGADANANVGRVLAGTISGTTITLGTETILQAALNAGAAASVIPVLQGIDGTSFAYLGEPGSAPRIGTVAGTVITMSAQVALPSPQAEPPQSATNATGNSLGCVFSMGVLGTGSFIFNDNYARVFQQTAGKLSGFIFHQVAGYWILTIDATRVLALLWNNDFTFSSRVLVAASNVSAGPIGLTAAGAASGQPVSIQDSGALSGMSGLTVGAQYYANGDGSLTTADIGHPVGRAVAANKMVVNV